MSDNTNLNIAKKIKNDEFYTLASDVENIIKSYQEYIDSADLVWCCFDGPQSEFWRQIFIYRTQNNKPWNWTFRSHISDLEGGDFFEVYSKLRNSPKLRDKKILLLSNPPFSKLREIIELIGQDIKDGRTNIIFVAPQVCATYKCIYSLVKEGYLVMDGSVKLTKFYSPKDNANKHISCYILTSYNVAERNYITNIKQDEPMSGYLVGSYNGERVANYDSSHFIDSGHRYIALPISYMFLQRKTHRIIGLLTEPKLEVSGEYKFKRWLVEKVKI